MDELVAAAQGEGKLTTIALPHDWCNYGAVIEASRPSTASRSTSSTRTPAPATRSRPSRPTRATPAPRRPDVIDVGLSFGPPAKAEGLIQPYKVATWDTIPADVKDADGYWYGDYYGVLAFETNTAVVANVPHDWADLLKPEYKGQVALAGDPRPSNQAIQAVYAAALANGGSLDDAQPGLDFFKQLNDAGNFVPTIATAGDHRVGRDADHDPLDLQRARQPRHGRGQPGDRGRRPDTGRFAGVYVQAISAYAPHPNAAKLWMEYLYSDEGQNIWLTGYCHPIRFDDLVARERRPGGPLAKLPDVAGRRLPDARAARRGQDADHRAVGRGRRRRTSPSRPT